MTISIRELSKINEFVSDIDELYQTELIYRMILVYNKNLNTYIEILRDNNNSVYVVKDGEEVCDYSKLDYRILMVKDTKYNSFIKNNVNSYFYNYILFTPCCNKNNVVNI
jgi:hypothetical protein